MNHYKVILKELCKTIWPALFITLTGILLFSSLSSAAENENAAPAAAERVNVDSIKEKYWARGNEAELGVVQNRIYTKAKLFELGVLGGIQISDPFLSTKQFGLSLGYHFTEFVAVHAFAWKSWSSPSAALDTMRSRGQEANINPIEAYYGAELAGSILYGKLSLMGKAIIHYDMHLLGGLGITKTESGACLTPHVGLGQQIYLSKRTSLKIDYRMMAYNEKILEKVVTPLLYREQGSRMNYTNAITFGISILLGNTGDLSDGR